MNAEILETLLIDRALGQLSPEVEALLAEHLMADPEAARAAAELSETVTLAEIALQRPARRLELPPPAVAMFPPRRILRVLALAASFVAGAGVALLALRGTVPRPEASLAPASAPSPAAVQAPSARRVETDPAVRALPFWSKERAVALASVKQSAR
jgi:anti-sigma factor RsiW